MAKKIDLEPLLVSIIMESSIDIDRTQHIQAGKLTQDILSGNSIYRAIRDDTPLIKKGDLGVLISEQPYIIIINNHNGLSLEPQAVHSHKQDWERTPTIFHTWKDLLVKEKPQEEPGEWYKEFQDAGAVIIDDTPKGAIYHIPFVPGIGRITRDKKWIFQYELQANINGVGAEAFLDKIGNLPREDDPKTIDIIEWFYQHGMILGNIMNKDEFKFATTIKDDKKLEVNYNFETEEWKMMFRTSMNTFTQDGTGLDQLEEQLSDLL